MPSTTETWNLCLLPANHPGVTEALAFAMCASACVCLHRHHRTGTRPFQVKVDGSESMQSITWSQPTTRERNANRNTDDASRDGGYALTLLCLEHTCDLVAIGRAEKGTGADWYVAPPGHGVDPLGEPDLDDPTVRRLEVGGHDDRPSLPYELKLKVQQLARGRSSIPGIAGVVGFKKALVLIQTGVSTGSSPS